MPIKIVIKTSNFGNHGTDPEESYEITIEGCDDTQASNLQIFLLRSSAYVEPQADASGVFKLLYEESYLPYGEMMSKPTRVNNIIDQIGGWVSEDEFKLKNVQVEEQVISFAQDRFSPYIVTSWTQDEEDYSYYPSDPHPNTVYTQADFDRDNTISGTLTSTGSADVYDCVKQAFKAIEDSNPAFSLNENAAKTELVLSDGPNTEIKATKAAAGCDVSLINHPDSIACMKDVMTQPAMQGLVFVVDTCPDIHLAHSLINSPGIKLSATLVARLKNDFSANTDPDVVKKLAEIKSSVSSNRNRNIL